MQTGVLWKVHVHVVNQNNTTNSLNGDPHHRPLMRWLITCKLSVTGSRFCISSTSKEDSVLLATSLCVSLDSRFSPYNQHSRHIYVNHSGGSRWEPPPPPPPLFWIKEKKWLKGKRPTGQVNQDSPLPPPPFGQGLDPPLNQSVFH